MIQIQKKWEISLSGRTENRVLCYDCTGILWSQVKQGRKIIEEANTRMDFS